MNFIKSIQDKFNGYSLPKYQKIKAFDVYKSMEPWEWMHLPPERFLTKDEVQELYDSKGEDGLIERIRGLSDKVLKNGVGISQSIDHVISRECGPSLYKEFLTHENRLIAIEAGSNIMRREPQYMIEAIKTCSPEQMGIFCLALKHASDSEPEQPGLINIYDAMEKRFNSEASSFMDKLVNTPGYSKNPAIAPKMST